jgi:hypothetical protein
MPDEAGRKSIAGLPRRRQGRSKRPANPLPRQRVSLSGPEASIFDLPNIACGMLFSVNMWADEFSAPNLVKAVPALQMHSQ